MRNARLGRAGRGVIGALVLFAVLEVLTRAEFVNPAYLPPASTIIARTAQILVDPAFLREVAGTMQAWAVGMVVVVAIGVPLGVLLGTSDRIYTAARALIEFLRPIPSVALIPLAILVFGRGPSMKTSLIIYAALWPVLFNTIYGMHGVEPVAIETARSFNLSRLQILRYVSLPSAAPFIYTGIRVATAIALILAISTELIAGGGQGIGTWMLARQVANQQQYVYAGTIVAGLLGLAINAVFIAGEKRLFSWHPRQREGL